MSSMSKENFLFHLTEQPGSSYLYRGQHVDSSKSAQQRITAQEAKYGIFDRREKEAPCGLGA